MVPSRAAASVLVLLLTGLYVSAAQFPQIPPAPPGYRQGDVSDPSSDERIELETGRLDRETVVGRQWFALYDALPAMRRSPLDVMRHYVRLAEAQGGQRLGGYVAGEGGKIVVFFPRSRPLWVEASPSENGSAIEVRFVEETQPRARTFAVPPERIPGAWIADVISARMSYPADQRTAVSARFADISAIWRGSTTLRDPKGGQYFVMMPELEEVPATGPLPVTAYLQVLPHMQACGTCPVLHATESRRLATVVLNAPDRAANALELKDAQGRTMHEWRPAEKVSATITRTRDRHIVLTAVGRPPLWLPVSRAAHLQAQIAALDGMNRDVPDAARIRAEQEEALKAMEKIDPAAAKAARAALAATPIPTMTGITDGQRAQLTETLAGLSDKERAAPAVLEDGTEIVVLNPAYFDRSVPRTGTQLVVVTMADPQDYDLADLVDRLKDVDWRPLMAARPERSPR